MKSIGSPLIGDDYYGGEPADRGYLHAYGLQFTCRFADDQPQSATAMCCPRAKANCGLPYLWGGSSLGA